MEPAVLHPRLSDSLSPMQPDHYVPDTFGAQKQQFMFYTPQLVRASANGQRKGARS